MWFKNLNVYRIVEWPYAKEDLENNLQKKRLIDIGSSDKEAWGWVAPKSTDKNFVYSINGQLMICLGKSTMLLPASVINQYVKVRALEYEDSYGKKPGRKGIKEIKEQVIEELLPRAFVLLSKIYAWIDVKNKLLVVDSASVSKADDFVSQLNKSVDNVNFKKIKTKIFPETAMTEWVLSEEVSSDFSIDNSCEIIGGEKSIIRFQGHSFTEADISRYIKTGKQVSKLGVTWKDKISFELNKNFQIKKISPLDILKEGQEYDEDLFDSDFSIMSEELHKMLSDLVSVLGGEVKEI